MGRKGRRGAIPQIPNRKAATQQQRAIEEALAQFSEVMEIPPGVICVPTQPMVWAKSALAIFGAMTRPPESLLVVPGPSSIAAKRNEAAMLVREHKRLEWLFFIDSDMVPAPDTLLELWRTGKDVVAGLCFLRQPGFPPAAMWRHPPPEVPRTGGIRDHYVPLDIADGRLLEVDFVGTGCLLIRRKVLEAIPYPWFEHPASGPGLGEDGYFCAQAQKAGFPIWLHTGVRPGHIHEMSIDYGFVSAMENGGGRDWDHWEAILKSDEKLTGPL